MMGHDGPDTSELLTTGQAARVLGISRATVRKAIARGQLACAGRTAAGHARLAAADVERYARGRQVAPCAGCGWPAPPCSGRDLLAALRQLIEELAASPDQWAVMDEASTQVAAMVGATRCAIWLFDDAQEHLLLAGAPYGLDVTQLSLARCVDIAGAGGMLAAIGAADEPETILYDAATAEIICQALGVPPGIVTPLLDSDGPLGLLYLDVPPSEMVADVARMVAAGLGLSAARTQATAAAVAGDVQASAQAARLTLVQETARELAAVASMQEVCDKLVQAIQARMGHHIVGVYLRRGDVLHLGACRLTSGVVPEAALCLPLDMGIVGHVAATGQPYLCHDTQTDPYYHRVSDTGTRAELAVPMTLGGDVVGVLNVESRSPHAFDQYDVTTLAAIADQAAIAVQNARLYEAEAELRRRAEARARRLEHVQRVGEELKMNLDEQAVGQRIVEAVRDALAFRMVVLNLIDRPGDPAARGQVVATAGLPPEAETMLRAHDFALSAIQALFHPAYRLSRSYFIPAEERHVLEGSEVTTWTPRLANSGADAWQAGDELLVPLTDRHDDRLLGFLSVDDPESGHRPEREEIELLEIFADQAVVALRNARLLAQARRQAERDHVTGLLNHRAAHAHLEAALSSALTTGRPLGLLTLDLDDFKLINDTYGHPTGDLALRHTAMLLQRCARAGDAIARLGGDEFLVVLPDASQSESAAVAHRLTAMAREMPLYIEGTGAVPVRLSVGVASCPEDADQPHTLLTIADTRLYEAKRAGGRTVETGQRTERAAGDLEGFDTLSALVTAVDNKDRYTREHSEQVAAFACALADAIGLSADSQRTLRLAGLLHDVGKIGVPDRVLRKPGGLEADEWEAMRQHVVLSTTLMRTIGADAEVVAAVAHHHERWDGQGYPHGLAGLRVPLLGRIMIVADAVSAMAMDRPYRKGLSRETIVAELRRGAGTQFDPALVEPFIAIFGVVRSAVA